MGKTSMKPASPVARQEVELEGLINISDIHQVVTFQVFPQLLSKAIHVEC